jgi:ferredoxin
MPKLTIDNREVEIEPGGTILQAARKLGIEIPTLCFNEECQPSTSCMVCVVKLKREGAARGGFVPSCATVAEDGMEVESETDEVHKARRVALELLLSDHLGDCIAPCHRICPAGMNIPLMLRQIAADELPEAIITVKRDIALPAVLGRICPAPCERGCRRGTYDSPVSICLLKRYVADVDLSSESPYLPTCKPKTGKRVAIEVLDAEIGIIEKLGAKFRMKTRIGDSTSIADLQRDYDAVLIATGTSPGVPLQINRDTLQTDLEGVFAAGNVTGRKSKMAVRSVADGKDAAASITQYLSGVPVTGVRKPFGVYIGKLAEGEIQEFMRDVNKAPALTPVEPASIINHSASDIRNEALRCLHCDCRKADNCKLRDYSDEYGADANKYKGERRLFDQRIQHPQEGAAAAESYVIYEPGKCIKCGLCIQITSKFKEELGLTFIGRGFDVRIDVPLNRSITEGLRKAAAKCVEVCPTGALAFK